jgi:hypothetical protein
MIDDIVGPGREAVADLFISIVPNSLRDIMIGAGLLAVAISPAISRKSGKR